MTSIDLRPDCTRCAALCCVALPFDRSSRFAIDKAANEPCPNLDRCGRCRIHSSLADRGFGGCVAFDCFGAGQRVTQEIFEGRSWQDDPALLEPMARVFLTATRAHECLMLLREAGSLPLSIADEARRAGLEAAVAEAGVSAEAIGALRRETFAFLASLRGSLPSAVAAGSGGRGARRSR